MKKVIAFVVVVFVAVLAVGAAMFYGNPVSKILVTHSAEKYLQENFNDTDFEIGIVNYDFKTSDYYVRVVSPSSADSSFTICAGLNGEIYYDSYEDNVVKKWNTAFRINDEYCNAVKNVIETEHPIYDFNIDFGEIVFNNSDAAEDESIPAYAVDTESLELDKVYDINEFGKKAGELTIYVYDEDVSCEKLAEILLGIRKIMDEADISFYVIDCVLEYPKPENPEEWKDDRVEVMDFLYDDIYQEGLVDRVKESDEEAKAYYARLDEMK